MSLFDKSNPLLTETGCNTESVYAADRLCSFQSVGGGFAARTRLRIERFVWVGRGCE